jgi:hypothetical protein
MERFVSAGGNGQPPSICSLFGSTAMHVHDLPAVTVAWGGLDRDIYIERELLLYVPLRLVRRRPGQVSIGRHACTSRARLSIVHARLRMRRSASDS